MADDDHPMPGQTDFSAVQERLMRAGQRLDNASDTLDNVDSRLSRLPRDPLRANATTRPMPQRRPIAAGPDAAGNDRSANRRRD